MSNAQISLKPANVADLHVDSEIDGLPLIEHFVTRGSEFYDEWYSALNANTISVTDFIPLSGGKVEVYFNISNDPIILRRTEQVLVSA